MGTNKSSLKSIDDIISGKYRFFIPAYQRGYRWDTRQVEDLLNDILEFMNNTNSENSFYCLQPLVVQWDEKHYRVIDGQQRLTTIYLILKALESFLKEEYIEDTFYSIEYETRYKSKEFLENINSKTEDESKENIDFYYIYNNFQFIKEWIEEKIRKKVFKKSKFVETLLYNVKFIWYELPENEDEIEVFQRLNIGKIPLTNSELIKAILLHHLKDYKDRLSLISEWDFIEKVMQDDRFFSFIYSEKDYDKPTRIDFIFEILANTSKDKKSIPKHDERRSFYIISKKINEKETDKEEISKEIWSKVKTIFRIFEEFYNDNVFYHLIGYLINTGKNINNIIKEYQDKDRAEFEEYLNKKIKKQFNNKNLSELDYETDRKLIEKLLFLYNVILTKNSNELIKKDEESVFPYIYNRYPFDLHKIEKWTLEHINPQTPADLDITQAKELLKRWKDIEYLQNKKREIEEAIKINNDEKIKNIAQEIYKILINDIEENLNTIQNLTLLSKGINSSLQNGLFLEKREKIINYDKNGRFIPIGTKNVFLRYYTENQDNSEIFEIWNKKDMKSYLDNLKDNLKDFIKTEGKDGKRSK